ncbi:hypothetical protein IGI37_000604 [Enterococcus sp. AZ194]
MTAVYGLDNRVTRDLDATIRKMSLNQQKVEEMISYIEQPDEHGVQSFKLIKQKTIREKFEYDGFNLKFHYILGKMRIPIEIDMTTGEQLLPLTEEKVLPLIFSEGNVTFPSYPLEQILADKLYTTLAYGQIDDRNSRTKDLYDIYFLSTMKHDISIEDVGKAINRTLQQREVQLSPKEFEKVLSSIELSSYQQNLWRTFAESNVFARDVSFASVMNEVKSFSNKVTGSMLSLKEKKLSIDERLIQAREKAKQNNESKGHSSREKDHEITD